MPDYEVKKPDPDVVGPTGRTIGPVFWKNPLDAVPLEPNVGVEILVSDGMRKRGAIPLLVDGVDVMRELKRARWFALAGWFTAALSTALAVYALVLIFLHH